TASLVQALSPYLARTSASTREDRDVLSPDRQHQLPVDDRRQLYAVSAAAGQIQPGFISIDDSGCAAAFLLDSFGCAVLWQRGLVFGPQPFTAAASAARDGTGHWSRVFKRTRGFGSAGGH